MTELMVVISVGIFGLAVSLVVAYFVLSRFADTLLDMLEKRQNGFDKLIAEQYYAATQRQAVIDRQFAEQESRLLARDKEIDLLIADIPKRVDMQMQAATQKYAGAWQEAADEFRQKGVVQQQENMDEIILGQDSSNMSLEEILEHLEAEKINVG